MEKTLLVNAMVDAEQISAQQLVVDACHVLAWQGHSAGLAGQVTLRDAGSSRMWTIALGWGLEEASLERLILVNERLETVHGAGRANPALVFHSWIYRRYPSIGAIIHTHPPALSAFSMLGKPLPVAHMDAAMFHEDCGYLAHWPGVPTGEVEGALISEALGGKRSAMLVNHGIVCVGQSMQEALYMTVFAERNARMCLDAMAAGTLQAVEPAAAREAHDFLLQPAIVNGTVAYWTRQVRWARGQ